MLDLTPEMVRDKFKERFDALKPEQRASFKQRFLVHDYEAYPNATLLCTLDIATGKYHLVWRCESIRRHLRTQFINSSSTVLVGFNNKNFDNKLTDAILDGANEETIKRISDELIEGDGRNVRWRSGDRNNFRPSWVGRTFDIGFDIGQRKIGPEGNQRKIPEVGLKRWERLNGVAVHRSSVPFDMPILRAEDIHDTEQYCLADVCATAWLLLSNEAWNPCLNARRVLVDDYNERGVDWEMTKPRITSIVLNASTNNFKPPLDWEDEHFNLPSNLRIHKHRDIVRAYTENSIGKLREMSSKTGGGKGVVARNMFGIPHLFGVGGVHGCVKGIWFDRGGGIYSLDAASLYPNMMRHYGLLSRCVVGSDRAKFGELIDLRVKVYKPKGDTRAEGLKLVLNGGFGSMGFDKSDMYDPVHFSSVTILGQLLMLDLLEKLERHIVLIQSNTDGVFFKLRNATPEGLEDCRKIVSAFEKRTLLEMEWTEFERMYQKDVSNYVARTVAKPGEPFDSGKVKVKGTMFNVKHCTVVPYLTACSVHAALNEGELLPTDGISIDRFALEIKRDKNSECFSVDDKPDNREWLDVVPVERGSRKRQSIEVICKDDGSMTESLFGDVSNDLAFRKRRKATNCPDYAALAENVTVGDIDLAWYANKIASQATAESSLDADDNNDLSIE
jgi:hypothetical protein